MALPTEKLLRAGGGPVFSSGPTAPPAPNQDLLAALQWIDRMTGNSTTPGALDQTKAALSADTVAITTSSVQEWLGDTTDGPDAIKASLLAIRPLLAELAQDRAKLAAPAPAKPATTAAPATPPAVSVTAAQAVGMSAGAFVLGGLIGGAVIHHLGKKKTAGAREDDEDDDEPGTHAAREAAPRRIATAKKPAPKPAPKED